MIKNNTITSAGMMCLFGCFYFIGIIKTINDALSIIKNIHLWEKDYFKLDWLSKNPLFSKNDSIIKAPKPLFYRGVSSMSYKLEPGILRDPDKSFNKRIAKEQVLMEAFARDIHCYKNEKFCPMEIYSLAQHYGLPTRLLDWTFNILKALYFACMPVENPELKKDGCIYCYNTKFMSDFICDEIIEHQKNETDSSRLSRFLQRGRPIFLGKDKNINKIIHKLCNVSSFKEYSQWHDFVYELYDYIIPMYPYRANERLLAQEGLFTLWLPNHKVNISRQFERYIFRILVPEKYKKSILIELDEIGINQKTLFPDLEHYAKYIK